MSASPDGLDGDASSLNDVVMHNRGACGVCILALAACASHGDATGESPCPVFRLGPRQDIGGVQFTMSLGDQHGGTVGPCIEISIEAESLSSSGFHMENPVFGKLSDGGFTPSDQNIEVAVIDLAPYTRRPQDQIAGCIGYADWFPPPNAATCTAVRPRGP